MGNNGQTVRQNSNQGKQVRCPCYSVDSGSAGNGKNKRQAKGKIKQHFYSFSVSNIDHLFKQNHIAETLLYMAARAQLVAEVIKPALNAGKIVVADRFLDSTVVYQGYGNGIGIKFIKSVGNAVVRGIRPDLTFIFDLGVKKGLSRAGKNKDRIESRSLDYHQRVRNGYLAIARREPRRIKVIKATGSRAEIQEIIRQYVERIL